MKSLFIFSFEFEFELEVKLGPITLLKNRTPISCFFLARGHAAAVLISVSLLYFFVGTRSLTEDSLPPQLF